MQPIKNFSIFKNNDHDGDEKKPTHYLSAKIGEDFQRIGVAWTKEGKTGVKFLSCSLDKPYKDKPGYTIGVELPQPPRDVSKLEVSDSLRDDEMPVF